MIIRVSLSQRWFPCLAALGICLATHLTPANAQDGTNQATAEPANDSPGVLSFVAPKTIEMLVGVRIQAGDGSMLNNLALTVFPTSWPEQKVEIVQANVPALLQYELRDLPGGNQQLLFKSRMIPAGTTVEATLQVRIEKFHILGPDDTSQLSVPRKLPRDVSQYLGNSPFIEANSSEIRTIVRKILAENPANDWEKIETMYDWVRENIEYTRGELKTVRQALRDRTGDCEEMTSTFVALCRAARVPARCVWIPNHCYAEFYLEDQDGVGHWFPCQLAGTRNFGSMPEYLPILQKGDRFKVPEKKELERYLADYMSSQKVTGRTDPKVEFIRRLLGDAANLPSADAATAAAQESQTP